MKPLPLIHSICITIGAIFVAGGAYFAGRTTMEHNYNAHIINGKYQVLSECWDMPDMTTSTDVGTGRIGSAKCLCKLRRISDGTETVYIEAISTKFSGGICFDNEENCNPKTLNYKKSVVDGCNAVCLDTCYAAMKNIWFPDILRGDEPDFN